MTNNKVTTVRFHMSGEGDIKAEHNRRDAETVKWEKHIDPNGKHEVIRDRDVVDVYEELFSDAIEEYDSKQKRKDRRIGGVLEYMEQVRADSRGRVNRKTRESGKNIAYEVIVGVGSVKPEMDETTGMLKRDENGDFITPYKVPDDICFDILHEYIATWDARNPHLRLYGAYIHGDEKGAVHAHLDFVPWADGYQRGMEKQTSIRKALVQQGCESISWTNNACVVWQERERAYIENILETQYGYTIHHPDAGKGKESIPWRVYAAEQESLKRIDDNKRKLAEIRMEGEAMEAELDMKKKELDEVTESKDAIEEMKNIIMPDGRSMWEHNLIRMRNERERRLREEEESKLKIKQKGRGIPRGNAPLMKLRAIEKQEEEMERRRIEGIVMRNRRVPDCPWYDDDEDSIEEGFDFK